MTGDNDQAIAPSNAPSNDTASVAQSGVDASPSAGQATLSETKFPIVGVGASAGGLDALTHFLSDLPTDTGMAFILIQHLDPMHETLLPMLLARSTEMPIAAAADGVRVSANHIYIIAPNTSLALEQGMLRVTPRDATKTPHLSINHFFNSLAKECPGRAIGVILSGSGTDGTVGLVAIKAAGGVTFAHDDTAEHSGMPMNAINHGCVDFVLPPGEIAKEIAKIGRHGFPEVQTTPVLAGDDDTFSSDVDVLACEDDEQQIARVIDLVRVRLDIDFTHYRATTIKRRISRRAGMLSLATIADYAHFLTEHPEETAPLVKDLLINVTSFFRDRAAFAALSTLVFPMLMKERQPTDTIRVWVAGCSTGQEVYSLVIELLQFLRKASASPSIQIFASDISEWALTKARAGVYPESIVNEVPAEHLARYFRKGHNGYTISKTVRDLCVFTKHDLTADTPFSKMDMISCRNTLIYLAPVLQTNVFQTFHFALKPEGILFLGSSESLGRSSTLFEVLDDKNRIFKRKLSTVRVARTVPPSKRRESPEAPQPNLLMPVTTSVADLQRAADRFILTHFAPAGVLLTDSMDIIQYRGNTQPYLQPAQGDASLNVLTMLPFGAAESLKSAVLEAKQLKAPVHRSGVALRREAVFREISLAVIPILVPKSNVCCFLILFSEQIPSPPSVTQPVVLIPVATGDLTPDAREVLQLRHELAATIDSNQLLNEQCHVTSEQLKTAQEEASSTTEEFRSTNEELQTAKEEVDAANEELVTVNDELRNSNLTLAQAMELTGAIVDTMRYPLLVLDAELRVESANQAFLTAFRVAPGDTLGRRIYQLGNGQWDISELRRLLEDILPHNAAFDDFQVTHDFVGIGQRTMLLNARRLHGANRRSLIVLVFADITEQNRLTNDLKERTEELIRSNAELDQFATVASHDLQEPLRMVSGYIALLQHRYTSVFDKQASEFMGFVTSGTERMTAMIKGILDYSKIGHHASEFITIDSAESVKGALANLASKIQESHAMIHQESLPHVRANGDQLCQLFQNLIGNAIKFRSTERPLTVHIRAIRTEADCTISVSDNGIGMEEGSTSRIFQLFQRLHSEKEYPGTGIGLATCKKIIEHHRGRIWVDSQPGIGSTFHFSVLPGSLWVSPSSSLPLGRKARCLVHARHRTLRATLRH